jgi:hypothetical protein
MRQGMPDVVSFDLFERDDVEIRTRDGLRRAGPLVTPFLRSGAQTGFTTLPACRPFLVENVISGECYGLVYSLEGPSVGPPSVTGAPQTT